MSLVKTKRASGLYDFNPGILDEFIDIMNESFMTANIKQQLFKFHTPFCLIPTKFEF